MTPSPIRKSLSLKLIASAGIAIAAIATMAQYGGQNVDIWWEAGDGRALPMFVTFPDSSGELMVLNNDGAISTRNHAFFDAKGVNGRACVTCHQPSAAMSLAAAEVRDRWKETSGKDPVFAAIDGSNCPTLPQSERSSHSLLLDRGLFRIYLPWPAAGVKPDFSIEVVRDPTGCNTDPQLGLHSEHPTISVYRRPRVVGNMKYVLGDEHLANSDSRALVPVLASLAADGRDRSLEQQASDAMHAHEEAGTQLSKEELQQILDFESQVFVAQTFDKVGGDLAEVDGPLGAWSLGRNKAGSQTADDASHSPIFMDAKYWTAPPLSGVPSPRSDFRQSVARGNALFTSRTFSFAGTANHVGPHGASATTGTCASCHNAAFAGSSTSQQAMDVGTTVVSYSPNAILDLSALDPSVRDLPLFKITCNKDAAPHPYLGRVLYTTDPGRALITGKCSDVGSIVTQQFRGLAARAPYFSNGSAKTLRDVVDYYDTRFAIHLTAPEKQDLTNFLSVL
jgi:mono/diheme cytochrome c family protein